MIKDIVLLIWKTQILTFAAAILPSSRPAEVAIQPLYLPSTSNLSALNPPPGFGINLVFNSASPVNPIGVYNVALDTLYRLSLHPWTSTISRSIFFSIPPYREQVLFEPSRPGRVPAQELETGYAILALYAGVTAMTPPTRNLFYDLKVMISKDGMPVGRCTIHSVAAVADGANTFVEDANASMLDPAASKMNSSGLSDPSGTFPDPEDPHFSLTYTFAPGSRINSKDIFLAAMDGIAAAARFNPGNRCARLNGATPGAGNGALFIISSTKHAGRVRFTYQYASRALVLLTREMQMRTWFGEVGFYVEYDGLRFGEGIVRRRADGDSGSNSELGVE